jgi:prolyl 4-hydroxylase
MQFSSLTAPLQSWLTQSISQGCSADALERSLCASGYPGDFARGAVAAAFKVVSPSRPAEQPGPGAVPGDAATGEAPAASTSDILAGGPNEIDAGDRTVHILFALNAPRVILFANLLATDECDALISISRGKLERSNVVDRQTGRYELHPDRTSEGTYFRRDESELVTRIERRIARLTDCPIERGEPIQVLHYNPGTQYKPHFDYFDPSEPGNRQVLSMGGQRVATLIMYLNDVEAGGSTVFPEIGLDVLPRRGNAVFFAYSDEMGRVDSRTLHGGSPVGAGEKWIATKWLRQRPYTEAFRDSDQSNGSADR